MVRNPSYQTVLPEDADKIANTTVLKNRTDTETAKGKDSQQITAETKSKKTTTHNTHTKKQQEQTPK